nr:MAG TPA: hypothetical protein [Bacteriophage sp.]
MGKFETLCNEYRENKRLIEELEAMNDALKSDILSLMGTEETHAEGAAVASYKPVKSVRFNVSAFKAAYYDIYLKYATPTEHRRFTVR